MNFDQRPTAGTASDPDDTPAPGASGKDGAIDALDFALLFAENLKLLIIAPLVAGLIAIAIGFYTTPTFTAITNILTPQQQQSASAALAAQLGGALAGLTGGAASLATKNPADQYVAFIKSAKLADALITRFRLKERWGIKLDVDARRRLEGMTRAGSNPRDGIITIEVDDENPKFAAEVANAYVDELRTLVSTLALTEPAQRRVFFETQLKLAKDNLTKAEIALRSSGINETALKVMPQSATLNLARIKAMITAQEIKLATLRASMTDSNPAYLLAREELNALRAELSKEERSEPVPTSIAGVEYISKARDFKYFETLFELMAKQYEVARIDEARDGLIIQVLDPANPPERKSRPRKAQNAILSTLATFFALVVFVLLREWLRRESRQVESAQKLARISKLLRLQRT